MTHEKIKNTLMDFVSQKWLRVVEEKPLWTRFENNELSISLYEDEITFSLFFGKWGSFFCCYALNEIEIKIRALNKNELVLCKNGQEVLSVYLESI